MNTNFLTIENVRIEKTAKGLVFYLPSNFGGSELKAFKEKHKDQIDEFKNL